MVFLKDCTLSAVRRPDLERYIPPAGSALEPYLFSIWRVSASPAFTRETILPKGNLDLLFNLGPRVTRVRNEQLTGSIAADTAFLVGLQTSAIAMQPHDWICVLGLSLRIETCAAVLPLPPGELIDLTVESTSVIPGIARLFEQLRATPDFSNQCGLLLRWLSARVAPNPRAEWLGHACRWLARIPDEARIGALAREHSLSARQVRRRFKEQLGIGPAQYVR